MSQDERYRQLALFSVIVAEVVITPAACGALIYFLVRESPYRLALSMLAVFGGLAIAFYRISLIIKRQKNRDPERK
jgi:hypothetical protein